MSEVQLAAVEDQDDFNDDEPECMTCHGQGWGIVGVDWDSDDPINGPYDGEAETCWNCHGSGLAKEQWLWS
ncbi:MAG: hypothetical protein ACRDI2_23800 [Chloroflexota bacterium]